MDPDVFLVLGLIIAAFSIPSVLSAMSDKRAPRASMITILIGGGLILTAVLTKPGGYTAQEIPDVFVRVVGGFLG